MAAADKLIQSGPAAQVRIRDGAGEPGAAPGLPAPRRCEDLAPHYDLTISHPAVEMDSYRAFDAWLARAAAARGLTCCLFHDGNVEEAIRRLRAGRLHCGFHLDYYALWHVADDPYARLAQAVCDSGGRTINLPERSREFTNKARAHFELLDSGFGVPPSLVIPSGGMTNPAPKLAQGPRLDGSETVFVKPANGFGSRGIVCVERCSQERLLAALESARQSNAFDDFLVQRQVIWPRLHCDDGAERNAYWRVFYCMGELMPFWWTKQEGGFAGPSYRRLTGAEIKRLRLQTLLAYARDLAGLCGMNWFSTEICLSDGDESSKYQAPGPDGRPRPLVAIDYVNDQCDVDVQSRCPGSPPDTLVRHVAERFAEAALVRKNTLPFGAAVFPSHKRAA